MRLPDGRIRKLRRSHEDPSCAHELTFSCYRQLPLLGRDRTRRWLIAALAAACDKHHLELWAYVLMPDHVHVLFAPRDPHYRIRQVLQAIKQPVARRAVGFLRQNVPVWLVNLRAGYCPARAERAVPRVTYHFWQPGGGYDRSIDTARTAWGVVQYIHNNPVKRGLVEHPTQWLWSSARWYAGEGDVVLDMDAIPPAF